jgi:hypothetical protein
VARCHRRGVRFGASITLSSTTGGHLVRVVSAHLSGVVIKAAETAYDGFTDEHGSQRPGGITRRVYLDCEAQREPVELRFSAKGDGPSLYLDLSKRLYQRVWVDVDARSPRNSDEQQLTVTAAGAVDDAEAEAAKSNGARRREPLAATR